MVDSKSSWNTYYQISEEIGENVWDKERKSTIDPDTYNEIDDQFAAVHALLSPERLRVEAVYAAPLL